MDLADDDRLTDYGLDSLDIIVMVGQLEDQFNVAFPEEAIFREEMWSIRELERIVTEARTNRVASADSSV